MAHRPTLKQLECLSAAAGARSLREAAERLSMSQPALSAQIRALEDGLGLTLFERRSDGARLTPAGRETLSRAEAVLEAAQSLVDFAAGAQGRMVGRLRLGVSPTVGPYLLPHVVARLHKTDPDLRLLVRESPPTALGPELAAGDHDAIIGQTPIRVANVERRTLFRERLLLMLAADHALARERSVDVRRLEGIEVLTLDPRFQLHGQVAALCETFGARLSTEYVGGSLDALRLMVGMGAGVAFAPEAYARSELRPGGDVVALPLKGRAVSREIQLVWRRALGGAAIDRLAAIAEAAFAEVTGDAPGA